MLYIRRAFASFLCLFGGWCLFSLYLYGHFYIKHYYIDLPKIALIYPEGYVSPRPPWWQLPTFVMYFSIPYIGSVWLGWILPLFLFLGPRSWVWKIPVAVLLFAAVGGGIMQMSMTLPSAPVFLKGVIDFAALIGAFTGLLSALYQKRILKHQTD